MASLRRLAFAPVVAVLVLMLSAPQGRAGEGQDMVAFGLGAYDMGAFDGGNDTSLGFSVEYRLGWGLAFIHPFVGFMATSGSTVYGYGGLLADIELTEGLFLTPNLAVGGFDEGSGQDLGHAVEFRSAIELTYRFADQSRAGVVFHHMSNAGLGGKNPGAESIFAVYVVPVSRLFGN